TWLQRSPMEIVDDWMGPGLRPLQERWLQHQLQHRVPIARVLRVARTIEPGPLDREAARRLILEELPNLYHAADPIASAEQLAAALTFGAKGKKIWGGAWDEIKEPLSDLREFLKKKFPETLPQGREAMLAAAEVGQRMLRVAVAMHEEYRQLKRRSGQLDFQDLLSEAERLLQADPERLAELQSRFPILLLDELQDTDPLQMRLVRQLCGAQALAGAIFAVGDAKQSIYRFRGAAVELFEGLRQDMPVAGRLDLSRNFRSLPGVLRFVNRLSQDWFPTDPPLEAARAANAGDSLCVHFHWVVKPKPPGQSHGETKPAEARALAQLLRVWLDNETPCIVDEATGELRRMDPRD
ncbi:MAG: UvrD-helicase domain-containing protein, partial [Gemmataceae bacterium]